jgi:hypothetical protein
VAGNLASLPLGSLLQATVTSTTPREAVLNVNGLALTVRTPTGAQLQAGAVFLVRVPPGNANTTAPTLELGVPASAAQSAAAGSPIVPGSAGPVLAPLPNNVGQTANTTATTASQPTTAGVKPERSIVTTTQPALVDVLGSLSDGRVRVNIDGQEQIATSTEPLAPGGRYVLQVESTPAGLTLKPPPDSPTLPHQVATAVLRTPAPDIGATLKPLQTELAALTAPPSNKSDASAPAVPATVRNAAIAVSNTLQTLFPSDPNPPNATQLQRLVEDGGLHFEAKLARLVGDPENPAPAQQSTASNAGTPVRTALTATGADSPSPNAPTDRQTANNEPTAANTVPDKPAPDPQTQATARTAPVDLKGDLLRLLQAVNDLGGAAQAPAAAAALHGIEAQQAANALAQANGAPYFLQVPFPDGGQWRTLRLSLEPQNQPDQPDAERAGRFRVFMHVPLTDLGETWIDAGLAGDKFRATIYLDRPAVRDRVRAALPDLQSELKADGFSEVLLNVRASSELPPGQRRAAGAVQAGRPDSVSVLDVRV